MVVPTKEKCDGTMNIVQAKVTSTAETTTTTSDAPKKNVMAMPDVQSKSSAKKKSSTSISESNDIRKSEDSIDVRKPKAKKAKRIRTLEETDTSLISKKRELNLKEFIRRHLKLGAVKMDYEVWELELLLKAARKSFQQGSSLAEFNAPVNICGDIHGQYSDLIRIFQACGLPFQKRYLFLGDYVDRGRHSLEVIVLLFACKIQFPKHIILLRGNHEVEKINRQYGFQTEVLSRFKDPSEGIRLYREFNEVFSEMPLAALVSGKILCMHGGISPELNTLDDIRQIKRPISLLKSGLVQDLLWADPDAETKGFRRNYIRCVSVMFGEDAVHAKLKKLGIQMVIRAHQVVEFGYAFFAGKKLITIFSAARYYEDVCNWGAVVTVNADLEISFSVFKPEEYKQNKEKKFLDTADEDDDVKNQL